jgi:hypothetical protein
MEWKLCRPGDTIELLGFTVHITEQNYQPFMDELDWYIQWYLGDRLGNWILPNPNPSAMGKLSQSITNAYIASGIIKVLSKYADRDSQPGFWERLRLAFSGEVPLYDD